MDRTDMILARASQYLRTGTARTTTLRGSRQSEGSSKKVKTPEDEVEAYLKSLTANENDGDKASKPKSSFLKKDSSPPPVAISANLSGRGRSFLKTKDSTVNSMPQDTNAAIDVPLHSSSKQQEISTSSRTISSPTPPSSISRRKVRAVIRHQSSDEAPSVNEDDEDQRLVAEQFQQALKTTGSIRPPKAVVTKPKPESSKRNPPLAATHESAAFSSSFSHVDESGNIVYSQTFEDDDEEEVVDKTELKSIGEVEDGEVEDEIEEEDDDNPFSLANVVLDVDEQLAAVDEATVPESRPETASSIASVAESIAESRPASAASVESEVGNYSDDFEPSSHSDTSRAKQPIIIGSKQPPVLMLNSGSTEPQTIVTTQNVLDESVATVVSESMPTDLGTSRSRRRAQSHGALLTPRKPSIRIKTEPEQKVPHSELPPKRKPDEEFKTQPNVQFAQQPAFSVPPQMAGHPIYLMFPPHSFLQQFVGSQLPQSTAPAETKALHEEINATILEQAAQKKKQSVISQQSPAVYLPFFLERSSTRMLVSQCRMLAESIKATQEHYENRLNKINTRENLK